MAVVTPGSAQKLNKLAGVANVLSLTNAEFETLGAKVLKKNIMFRREDGKLYISDGVTAINQLKPFVDQVLDSVEKAALTKAFGTGSYVATEGGVPVLTTGGKLNEAEMAHIQDGKVKESYLAHMDGSGKVLDSALNTVTDGHITDKYLAKFYDGDAAGTIKDEALKPIQDGKVKRSYLDIFAEDGKIKLEDLPDTVRAGVVYVPDIAGRDSVSAEQKKSLIFVIDASADESVVKGSAMYAWQNDQWIKIAEVESLDLDIAALTPDHGNVEAAGAVMYDHMVELEAPTMTDYFAKAEAAQA